MLQFGHSAVENTAVAKSASSRKSPLPNQTAPLRPPTVRIPSPLPTLDIPLQKPTNHQR